MTILAAALLCVLGALHVYWALGGRWGSASAVPTSGGKPLFTPGPLATLAVAIGLFAMATALVWRIRPAAWLIVGIFALRAIGDFRYAGFFKRIRGTRFARLDTILYSPLCLLLALLIAGGLAQGQELSAEDEKGFRAEVKRIEGLLTTAGDKPTVQYVLARTYAAGGQWADAMRELEKAVALNVGLNPANDSIFKKIKDTPDFQWLLEKVLVQTPPIARARPAFTIREPQFVPEGIAYEEKTRRFLLGNTLEQTIVSCDERGSCLNLVKGGSGEILGLRVDPRDHTLWAAGNSENESQLMHYHLPSGALIRKYKLSHKDARHELNDLVVDHKGNVFVTDSAGGVLYWLPHGASELQLFRPDLSIEGANGIAIHGSRLYVAGFPDGITVVDIASRKSHPLPHPADLCLASIDGLYFSHGSLYAIQNSVVVHRVVRFRLAVDLDSIVSYEVLERRSPLLGEPTTAAIVGHTLFFPANSRVDVLALDLNRN